METITRRENMLRAYRHQMPWFIPSASDIDVCIPSVLEEGPTGIGKSQDGWGTWWLLLEGQPGPMPDESAPVALEDITEWREVLHFPDVEKYDWEKGAAEDTAGWDRENRISSCIIVNGMWERFDALCGFENALCNLIAEPEESFALMSALADHKIKYMEKIAKYYKPDKIVMHDDYGTEKAMFFNPDLWRELFKPNLKKVVDACHDLGMIYEHHSCGYIVPILDDFTELGIDAWNPVQNPNQPLELIKKYKGKLTFVGGFNDRLFINPAATDEEKRASIDETVQTFGEAGCWMPNINVSEDYIYYAKKKIYEFNLPKYEALGLTGPLYAPPSENEGPAKAVYETAETFKK